MGGEFLLSAKEIGEKLKDIRVLLFDWDGVFHSGHKNEQRSSSFSEADSMGINMLRFALWLQNGTIPYTAIVTGENNETAKFFAEREHFDAVFMGMKDKIEVLDKMKNEIKIGNENILFVYDDILDLSLASEAGLRFLVNRTASRSLHEGCKAHNLCDYITGNDGGNHAIREVTELCLSAMGKFGEVIEKRAAYGTEYNSYIDTRNSINTRS